MKILNVIASLDPSHGGPIEGALRLSEIWRSRGHEIDFVTLDSPDATYLRSLPGQIFALGSRGSPDYPAGAMSLWRRYAWSPKLVPWMRMYRGTYDAVIVHSLWNYSIFASRLTLVGKGIPYFVFPHGTLDPWFRSAYPIKHWLKQLSWIRSEGPLLNGADAVFFTTEEERILAQGSFWPYNVKGSVVGFGARDVSGDARTQALAFRAAVPSLRGRRYLLFLSRLHAKKGCDLLIQAFARISHAFPDLDLVVAGPNEDGVLSELEALATSLDIAPRVHFTGMISGDVKWGAYRECDAFCLTSHSENFGIVVAEALACSRPVLISNKVNLWREVVSHEAGLVEDDSLEGSVKLLQDYLALDRPAKARMSVNARECYEQNFRMEATAAAVMTMLEGSGNPR